MSKDVDDRTRWLAFATLCLGDLMIVLDSTVVNVALPSIRASLGFSEAGLVWVFNAYLLTFGGFLLLGGRLADIYGPRRIFLIGLAAFTAASLACGAAWSAEALVVARFLQGFAGAVVSAVALSLIMGLFPEGPQRVRAMGYFGFISAGGGSVGVLLGGLITDLLDWRWVFLINLPVGAAVFALSLRLLDDRPAEHKPRRLDVAGAVLVTAALMLAIYAIVGTEQAGWTSARTLGLLATAAALFGAFLLLESRLAEPLVPLGFFRLRNVRIANIVSVLWAAGMFAWFFLAALYLQRVLGYSALQVGLAFLPSNLIMGAFSYRLSALTVERLGIRTPLALGLALASGGLALFAVAPAEGRFLLHVLPGMLLLGLGAGMAFNPIFLAAMNDVEPEESGLASGVLNTAFMMGGALGLAVLASLAAFRTGEAAAAGAAAAEALTQGYRVAFAVGAACTLAGAATALLLRPKPGPAAAAVAH